MKEKLSILVVLLGIFSNSNAQLPAYPFPQHVTYTAGTIKPNYLTITQLDNQVKSFYDTWKSLYLKQGCDQNSYYIQFTTGNDICVSEGQGFGMVIVAYMAGYDADAKTYYDGLYKWYKDHPSGVNPVLMCWKQGAQGCASIGFDAATDGDLDIAYSLLLADKQWGSDGAINYLQEAITQIAAIKQSERFAEVNSMQLGDWANGLEGYEDASRACDFMLDHFRSFKSATNDVVWNKVLNKSYGLVRNMQTNYSPSTGLLPDFIEDVDDNPRPAAPNFLEGPNDGSYSYNACRAPWRIANDYLLHGDTRSKRACNKINKWLRTTTGDNVDNIRSGYKLDGTNIQGNNYQDLSFIAPFTVSACVNSNNQQWLNNLWQNKIVVSSINEGYFPNTIKMYCMILISGNYWKPESFLGLPENNTGIIADTKSNIETSPNEMVIFPNPADDRCSFQLMIHESSTINISVINQLQQVVMEKNYSTQPVGKCNIELDISNLSKGLYTIRTKTDHKITTQKLVKK